MFFGWMYYEYSYKPQRYTANQLVKIHQQIEGVYSVSLISGWGSLSEYTAIVEFGLMAMAA
jgi:hypothetical protein